MSTNLDKINFKKFDPEDMADSIEKFPELCKKAWDLSLDFALPSFYIKAKKFLFIGMGGSGIAGDIVKDLLSEKDIVIESVHDYEVPGWVDEDTIVIATSYSGNTEETISGFIDAYKKGAKPVIITTGGKLKTLAEKYGSPCISFDYKSESRAAFPYMFILLLSVFVKLGYYDLSSESFSKTIEFVDKYQQKFKLSNPSSVNSAKSLARKIFGKTPVIYSSGVLRSVGFRFKTQFNENSKYFSFCEHIPELNHNSLEGIHFQRKDFFILILESSFDLDRNTLRQNITSNILKRYKISSERIKFVPMESKLAEILVAVLFGDYLSYYLAFLDGANPSWVRNIKLLKSEMAN